MGSRILLIFFGAPMKLNQIAIASLALVAGTSFAACTKDTAVNFVNTCAPAKTFYIAGASALGDAVNSVVVSTFFDTTALPSITNGVVEVVDMGSPSGYNVANPTNAGKSGQGVKAWYGMSKVNPGETLLVVYNSYMGSAAGVSNVMSDAKLLNATTVPESLVVRVGPTTTGTGKAARTVDNNCTAVTSTITPLGQTDSSKFISSAANKVACTTAAVTRADIALSDVDASELVGYYGAAIKGGAAKFPTVLATMKRDFMAMQGFGVAVNNNFYGALQKAQGLYAGTPGNFTGACAPTETAAQPAVLADDTATPPVAAKAAVPASISYKYTEACQPSITKAQYTSLVTAEGNIKSAAGFIPDSTEVLTLARRDVLSGTQATSDMYFAAAGCNALDAKSKVNTHGGALTVIGKTASVSGLVVNENVQTGDVETDLKKSTGFSIGVISLSKATSSSYKFVKLNGASPNFAKGGTSPSLAAVRNNMKDGLWDLQVASYAIYPKLAVEGSSAKANLIKEMVAAMGDSGKHDLPAIAYIKGTDTTKHTNVSRVAGNNCSPLVARTN